MKLNQSMYQHPVAPCDPFLDDMAKMDEANLREIQKYITWAGICFGVWFVLMIVFLF